MEDILYILVPCYNETEVIENTAKELIAKLDSLVKKDCISPNSKILFINDGSKDDTWAKIKTLHKNSPYVEGLSLSRNVGHQSALLAGLMKAISLCDVCISIDADLQDDIAVFDEMLRMYKEGCHIVYGVRSNRDKDSFFKRSSAQGFYRLLSFLGLNTIYNHADFRLMSRQALLALSQFEERNLFLRGIIPMIGYQSACVYYERKARTAGETKYPLPKMLALAVEGITSLSIKPIRMLTFLGIGIFLFSLGMLTWSVVEFFRGSTIIGWSSVMASVWGIGGLILLGLGVIAEYIGKIYIEVKKRPRYIWDESLQHKAPTSDSEAGLAECKRLAPQGKDLSL